MNAMKNCGIFILFSLLCLQAYSSENDPMVAFTCKAKRPAVYKLDNGWRKDRTVGCLKDPVEILRFCKKSFPNLAIFNVVEAKVEEKIDVWCKSGKKKCLAERVARPFRCLVGPFQSDALLVPDKCAFDHEHNPNLCANSTEWKKIAETRCQERGMVFDDHAILLPCGLDAFNGVEFVCCPKAVKTALNSEKDKAVEETKKTDLYHTYLENDSPTEFRNEHEYFMKAKHDLEKQQHEKIANMMKEWTNERQRLDSLKKTKGQTDIDKLTQKMTAKYQKIYSDLEKTYAEEKSTFLKKHEVRVEKRLDEKKHDAMKAVLAAVDKKNVNYDEVRKSMAKFIRTEMKDQEHYINRWIHLQRTDKQAAEKVLKVYLDKIEMSNERIDQTKSFAIDHLNANDASELKQFCEQFIKEYSDVTQGRQWMLAATPEPPTEKPVEKIVKEYDDDDTADDDDDSFDEDDDDDNYDDEDDDDFDSEDEDEDDGDVDGFKDDEGDTDDEDADDDEDEFEYDGDEDGDFKLVDGDADEKGSDDTEVLNGLDKEDDDEDDDIFEDVGDSDDEFGRDDDKIRMDEEDLGDKYVDNKEIEMDRISSAHVAELSAHHPDRAVSGHSAVTASNAWVICVVAFAGAAMLGIIVVAAVMKHKRQMKRQRIARVEAESCVMDVEKRHLTTMQCNGYENPTYKYLETGTQ